MTTVADEILKLKNLLDMGAITQEEFDSQKSIILSDEEDKSQTNDSGPLGINGHSVGQVLKNVAVRTATLGIAGTSNKSRNKSSDKKLIKSGVMCPKCHSQDIIATGFRKSIISLAGKQRGYMTCKNCGNSWRI